MTYKISKISSLADIFEKLEKLKLTYSDKISGYTVNQPTLEQIFLKLTKQQIFNEKS